MAASLLAQAISREDIKSAEMIALPIAALLTLLFFRSVVAALLPIVIGGFALASCAAIMRLGAHFTEIAIFALNVSAFLGLGLSIDYSLLLVQRFRQELGSRAPGARGRRDLARHRRPRRLGVGPRRDREPRGADRLPGRDPAQRRDRRRARHADRAGRGARAAPGAARLARPEGRLRRRREIARGEPARARSGVASASSRCDTRSRPRSSAPAR